MGSIDEQLISIISRAVQYHPPQQAKQQYIVSLLVWGGRYCTAGYLGWLASHCGRPVGCALRLFYHFWEQKETNAGK